MSTDIRTALAELLGAAKECSRIGANPGKQWGKLTVAMLHAEVALAAQPAPQAEPAALSDEQIEAMGHRMCWRYAHSTDPAHSSTYKFNLLCLLDFARTIERAVRKQP